MVAGGLIVQAADTGRVLMIQRTPDKHDDDAAYARWEWPGGCLDVDDEGVWQGALREWEEETGAALGDDAEHAGSFLSHDGRYQSYVIRIPSEADLVLDPQPEEVSQAGWWDPADLDRGEIRDKVRDNMDLLARFLIGSEALKSLLRGKAWYGEASSGEAWSGKVGRGAASGVRKASLASYHRHTDVIVSHYQGQIAEALESLFPENALREAIQQVKDRYPDAGSVEKALIPAFVSTAVAALRARLSPSKRLARVLSSLYSDAALQASRAATEAVGGTVGDLGPLMQDLPADYWSNWTPGWADAASQLSGGGLQSLLDSADVTIRSIEDSRIGELGDAIARGVEAGDSVDQIARDCRALLTAPQRSFMIANTEVCRAMTVQTLSDYRQSGVEMVQWLAEGDACPDCEENEDASPIAIGDAWPNGEPPVHPNCRCALAPSIDTSEGGSGDGA